MPPANTAPGALVHHSPPAPLYGAPAVLEDLAEGDEALSLAKVTRHPLLRKDGRGPSPQSVYRWVNPGLRGVRLEVARVGGSLVTSRGALTRFLNRLSGVGSSDLPPSARARREHARAAAELDAAGI